MPGVYEKTFIGPDIDVVLSRVAACRKSLDMGHCYDEHFLALMQSFVAEKEALEKVCFCGGLTLLFDILIKHSNTTDELTEDVGCIIRKIAVLLSIKIDSYDNDIGHVPLLVFFLTERHRLYVDINWTPDEATYMTHFIRAYQSVLCNQRLGEGERVLAADSFALALLAFPCHRVTSTMADCFDETAIQLLCHSINRITQLWSSVEGLSIITRVLLGICTFGLGLEIAHQLPVQELIASVMSHTLPNRRCPCPNCEYIRRLRKQVIHRDEFGVLSSCASRSRIMVAFYRGGIIGTVRRIIKTLSFIRSYEVHSNQSTDSIEMVNVKQHTDVEYHKVHAVGYFKSDDVGSERPQDRSTNSNSETDPLKNQIINPNNTKNDEGHDTTDGGINSYDKHAKQEDLHNTKEHTDMCVSLYDLSIPVTSEDQDLCSIDEIGENLSLILQIIITVNRKEMSFYDKQDVTLFLLAIINDYSAVGPFTPGVLCALQVLCSTIINESDERQLKLFALVKHKLTGILELKCREVIERSRDVDFRPSLNRLALPLAGIITINCLPLPSSMSNELFKLATEICEIFIDGYYYVSIGYNPKVFLAAVIASMSVLIELPNYMKCEDVRRRFLSPPPIACSSMVHTGRKIYDIYRSLYLDCGCVIQKDSIETIILLAERAGAITKIGTTVTTDPNTGVIVDTGTTTNPNTGVTVDTNTDIGVITNIDKQNFSSTEANKENVLIHC